MLRHRCLSPRWSKRLVHMRPRITRGSGRLNYPLARMFPSQQEQLVHNRNGKEPNAQTKAREKLLPPEQLLPKPTISFAMVTWFIHQFIFTGNIGSAAGPSPPVLMRLRRSVVPERIVSSFLIYFPNLSYKLRFHISHEISCSLYPFVLVHLEATQRVFYLTIL